MTKNLDNTTDEAAADGSNAPAVSARILKKRETDRRCQRMIRERTKSRIAYLESLVEQFRQQDSSGRVETLMQQLDEAIAARDNLARKVKNIENIISDNGSNVRLKEEDVQETSTRSNRSPPSVEISRTDPVSPDAIATSSPATPGFTMHNKEYAAYLESSAQRATTWAPSTLQPPPDQYCECSLNTSALDPTKPLNKWRYANDTLTEWFKWPTQALDMTRFAAYNDDVPVRAIVEGWDAVEKHGHMHPIWRLLRGIDENMFAHIEPRERLAILMVMGLLMQTHLNPTSEKHKELPKFYLKRPSQDLLHSYATEYLAWPGLREKFINTEHRYCSNMFWQLFCKDFRFVWQYEFRDCYIRNTETGLYSISPTFHDRIHDIKSWSMGQDFFKAYPECKNDIPSWGTIPPAPSALGRQVIQVPMKKPLQSSRKGPENETETSQLPHTGHVLQSDPHQHMSQAHTNYNQYIDSPGAYGSMANTPSAYNFYTPGVPTSMAEMQHLTPTHNWSYGAGLDAFHVNPT